MQLRGRVDGISASLAYDVLQDSEYRATWDSLRKDSFPLCSVGDSGEIGYYLSACNARVGLPAGHLFRIYKGVSLFRALVVVVRFPRPLCNREFLTHRFWRARPGEYLTMNHSVYHKV